ncbi:MAG TPA: hypothetical protein VJA66_13485 [Thermoanaerobaculia bacterium]
MRIERLHGWVFPVVLAVIVADVNFFLDAAISDQADYVGIAFFALFGLYGVQSLLARREFSVAMSTLGAAAGLGLMLLREAAVFDKGYIPPYLVFIGFVLAGYLIGRVRRPSS